MEEFKKCPYCSEDIKAAAVKCRFCQSTLSLESVKPHMVSNHIEIKIPQPDKPHEKKTHTYYVAPKHDVEAMLYELKSKRKEGIIALVVSIVIFLITIGSIEDMPEKAFTDVFVWCLMVHLLISACCMWILAQHESYKNYPAIALVINIIAVITIFGAVSP